MRCASFPCVHRPFRYIAVFHSCVTLLLYRIHRHSSVRTLPVHAPCSYSVEAHLLSIKARKFTLIHRTPSMQQLHFVKTALFYAPIQPSSGTAAVYRPSHRFLSRFSLIRRAHGLYLRIPGLRDQAEFIVRLLPRCVTLSRFFVFSPPLRPMALDQRAACRSSTTAFFYSYTLPLTNHGVLMFVTRIF